MQIDQKPSSQPSVMRLEISCSGKDRLTTSLSSQQSALGDVLRTYEECHVSLAAITHRSHQLFETLNQANRHGRLSHHLLRSLKDTGQLFRDELLSPKIKERLNASSAQYLSISMDERLVQIPWELLHDGSQFLCQRYAVGRLVQTKQDVRSHQHQPQQGPLQALILADLDGSLPAARKEGKEIRQFLESLPYDVRIMMRSASVSKEFLRTKIRHYQWVHYAGHADYDDDNTIKGWRLSSGWFTAADVEKMMGTGTMPSLIFANACQSARTGAWSLNLDQQKRVFGLVNAFLLSGTQHFLGTSWEIPDEPGRSFALAFYRHLTEGMAIGQAVHRARQQVIKDHGEQQLVWASYLLYGDPTYRYTMVASDELEPSRSKPHPDHQNPLPIEAIRTSEPGAEAPTSHALTRRRTVITAAIIGTLVVLLGLIHLSDLAIFNSPDTNHSVAQAAYRSGDYEAVLDACPEPVSGSSIDIDCTLLRANVLLSQGDLQNADQLYQLAFKSARATASESCEALMGLGRIASIRGNQQSAIRYYRQAAQAAPRRKGPLLALAMLHEAIGQDREALALVEAAERLGPSEDVTLTAMRRTLTAKLALDTDAERMARVDQLIDDLSRMATSASSATGMQKKDRALGIWLMTMEVSGYGEQEGAPELFTALMENRLQAQPNLQVVDRHFMAKTLSELKLGTSGLSDPQARLRLGRLQAAHLLVSGRMVFAGPETQITLRCIDIETSRLLATIVSTFKAKLSLDTMAMQIVEKLIQKLD